ncbi:D-lyxose/D-mannose family sugar isomerase [Kiritimatiella glycovorans]|uniref:D-lyxose ketol-isomerase n=1 Tax=Kiritimatiella glycovorans TaxID=1307763 RepID=A0A0G3EDD8_9BACT|nr:D-lyxose/D-mannose family sugar isomerase [Kiritimatiella glycovorans]AKJ64486.1 ABC-type sugar transport system, auxiliary component [Kiritimatiella glycovorans]
MKRSEINEILRESKAFFERMQFVLPPVAFWSPDEFRARGSEAREIIDCGIGWDLTDFGRGHFHEQGLTLFTLRNGVPGDARYPKPYAEKIMIVGENQLTLTHHHWKKTEDIINRGGGTLILRVHTAAEDETLSDDPVTFSKDGVMQTVPPGTDVRLEPGESITLTPRLYHSFWGEAGCGPVLVGEVSAVNDDHRDNAFLEPQLRFPEIEEDEPPLHLLVGDYPEGGGGAS